MPKIQIDPDQFEDIMRRLKISIETVHSNISLSVETTTDLKPIVKQMENFQQILKIMNDYRTILLKDNAKLVEIGNALVEKDKQLKMNFNQSTTTSIVNGPDKNYDGGVDDGKRVVTDEKNNTTVTDAPAND